MKPMQTFVFTTLSFFSCQYGYVKNDITGTVSLSMGNHLDMFCKIFMLQIKCCCILCVSENRFSSGK